MFSAWELQQPPAATVQTHILVPEGVPHLPHAEGHTPGGTPFLDPLELELSGHRECLKEGESTGLSKMVWLFHLIKGRNQVALQENQVGI